MHIRWLIVNDIPYSGKFLPGENIHELLFCVNDYIEDMVTFTALVKFIPVNTSASWLVKFLSSKNFRLYGKIMQ